MNRKGLNVGREGSPQSSVQSSVQISQTSVNSIKRCITVITVIIIYLFFKISFLFIDNGYVLVHKTVTSLIHIGDNKNHQGFF